MAVRIAVFCVNIPVFSPGDSDLESTVQSLESRFLALRQHTQGPERWSWGGARLLDPRPEGGDPAPSSPPWGGAQLLDARPEGGPAPSSPPWALAFTPTAIPPVLAGAPHHQRASGDHGCSVLLPGWYLMPVLGPFEPEWKLGSWNRTSCSYFYQLKWQYFSYIKSFWLPTRGTGQCCHYLGHQVLSSQNIPGPLQSQKDKLYHGCNFRASNAFT